MGVYNTADGLFEPLLSTLGEPGGENIYWIPTSDNIL